MNQFADLNDLAKLTESHAEMNIIPAIILNSWTTKVVMHINYKCAVNEAKNMVII